MRVAVFGGSFNPPHVGHALVAGWLHWAEHADAVWLVPCADHPLGKRGLEGFEARAEWCRALADAVGPWVRVETIEQELPRPSYTIRTLEALSERYPEHTFRLVVGADILEQVDEWQDWAGIEQRFSPIVVGRAGHRSLPGVVEFPRVSSTEIRRALGRGEPPTGVLPGVQRLLGDAYAGAPMRRSGLLQRQSHVVHGFGGSRGGGRHEVIDLGPRPRGDLRREMWEVALRGVDASLSTENIALLDQVHGAHVLVDPRPGGCASTVGQADAVVSTQAGVVLAVRTADCVPVLMSAPGGVAAVHAGWRGVVAGVLQAAVEALCEATGCAPSDVIAAVGPHASAAHYETGPEVVEAMVRAGVPREKVCFMGPRREHTNLRGAVTHVLEAAGVGTVEHVSGCTLTDADLHSHRRDGELAGRQASFIARVSCTS